MFSAIPMLITLVAPIIHGTFYAGSRVRYKARRLDTLFHLWDNEAMPDFNALHVFAKVASLRSFSAAAKALGLPKSSVSRNVARLEEELGARLLQRSTRHVVLTPIGKALYERCADPLGQVVETWAA